MPIGAKADQRLLQVWLTLDVWGRLVLLEGCLNSRRWTTRGEIRLAIVTWIERTYHRRRRQRGLGKLTPVEFETMNRTAHAA